MSHYYLAASLPRLALGADPGLTPEQFAFSCSTILSAAEQADLQAALDYRPEEGEDPFFAAWREAETQIANAVARARAARACALADDCTRETTSFSGLLQHEVAEAFEQPNPLQLELHLDRTRWAAIEEIVRFVPFSFAAVLAFAARLALAARWAAMDEETGREQLETIISQSLSEQGLTP